MEKRVQIEEVIEKVIQGQSGVHRCYGEDGHYYYTKGYQVGREDQAKEWICAHLARRFGLPIADFCLVEVDECLYQYLRDGNLKSLGYGICFGSRQIEQASWLEPNKIAGRVPETLRADILVFDWWIKNLDRSIVNPNLLWGEKNAQLAVIDHNLAFDPVAKEDIFFKIHIFQSEKDRAFGNWVARQEYEKRMEAALEYFQEAVDTVREAWPWHDLEQTVPFELDSQTLLATLEEYKTDQFWRAK